VIETGLKCIWNDAARANYRCGSFYQFS